MKTFANFVRNLLYEDSFKNGLFDFELLHDDGKTSTYRVFHKASPVGISIHSRDGVSLIPKKGGAIIRGNDVASVLAKSMHLLESIGDMDDEDDSTFINVIDKNYYNKDNYKNFVDKSGAEVISTDTKSLDYNLNPDSGLVMVHKFKVPSSNYESSLNVLNRDNKNIRIEKIL
jgi:hypothetical protein